MTLIESAQVLGSIGEFVGSIAVLATLVYLAVQLKQNTALVRSSSHQGWLQAVSTCTVPICESKQLSDVITQGIADSRNLSEETWLQFIVWNQQLMYMVQTTHLAFKNNSIDPIIYEHEVDRAVSILRWPGVRQWWDAGGRDQVSTELVELLELRLSQQQRFAGLNWNAERGFFRDPGQFVEPQARNDEGVVQRDA